MIIVEIMSVKQFSNACLLRDVLLIQFSKVRKLNYHVVETEKGFFTTQ